MTHDLDPETPIRLQSFLAKDPLVLPVIRGMRPMVSELLKPDPPAGVQKR